MFALLDKPGYEDYKKELESGRWNSLVESGDKE